MGNALSRARLRCASFGIWRVVCLYIYHKRAGEQLRIARLRWDGLESVRRRPFGRIMIMRSDKMILLVQYCFLGSAHLVGMTLLQVLAYKLALCVSTFGAL